MHTAADALIRAQLADLGLAWLDKISWNAPAAVLYQDATPVGEGLVAEGGGLVVSTGQHTGRSPNDKFIVRDAETEDTIWWDNNKAHEPSSSSKHCARISWPMPGSRSFTCRTSPAVPRGLPAAHPRHHRICLARAVHPAPADRAAGPNGFAPKLTIIDLPSFKADPARHGTRSETVIALDSPTVSCSSAARNMRAR